MRHSYGMNMKVPRWLMCLNTWPPAGDIVWTGCRTFPIWSLIDRYRSIGTGLMGKRAIYPAYVLCILTPNKMEPAASCSRGPSQSHPPQYVFTAMRKVNDASMLHSKQQGKVHRELPLATPCIPRALVQTLPLEY